MSLTNAQIEAMFGGQADIQAARSADPGFNLAQWYQDFGRNEVASGARSAAPAAPPAAPPLPPPAAPQQYAATNSFDPLEVLMGGAQDYTARNTPGQFGGLTDSQLEAYFGGQADIKAARSSDPNFNLAQWYQDFGRNEVASGARGLSQTAGNIYATPGGDTAFTAGINAFDNEQYLAKNQDVANAIKGGQFTSGLQHFLTYGQKEGRDPNARVGYLNTASAARPDLAATGAYNPNSMDYAPMQGQQGWMPGYFDGAGMNMASKSFPGMGFPGQSLATNPFAPQNPWGNTFMAGFNGGRSTTDALSQILATLQGGGGFGFGPQFAQGPQPAQTSAYPTMAAYQPAGMSSGVMAAPQGAVGAVYNPLGGMPRASGII